MNFKNLINTILPITRRYQPAGRRIQGLDLLKFIAFIAVLLHHTTQNFCYRLGYWGTDIYYYFWSYIFPILIPIFFAVSGYTLLGRENSSYRYVFRKIFNILKICLFAELICEGVRYLFIHQPFEIERFIKEYFEGMFIHEGRYSVTWFLGALIVIYLLYPVLNRWYREYPKIFLSLMAGCLVIQTIFFLRTLGFYEQWMRVKELEINLSYRYWNWMFYFCLGGAIKKYRQLWRLGHWWIAIGVSLVNTCLLQMYMVRHYGELWFESTYASPICIVNVIAVICLILSLKIENRCLKELPMIFFPAFIIGDTFMECWLVIGYSIPSGWGLLSYFLVTVATTLLLTWLLIHTPFVKDLLRS